MGQDQSCCSGSASEREQSRNNEDFGLASKPHKQSEDVEPGPDSGTKANSEATLPAAAPEILISELSEAALPSNASVRFAETQPTSSDTSKNGQDSTATSKVDKSQSTATSTKSEETFRSMNTKEAFSSFAPGLASEEHRDALDEQGDAKESGQRKSVNSEAIAQGGRNSTLAAELEEDHYNATHTSAKVGANASGTHAGEVDANMSMETKADGNTGAKADTPDADNTDVSDTPKKKKCCVMM